MSDAVAFRWVEIEAFRGFNHKQRLDLDGSAVVVVGPNGTGKTSFFDALQWLLLGTLDRLARFRVHKNDEHIVNRYRGSELAVVEAEFDIRDVRVRLRRQGRYNEGLLELHSGSQSLHGHDAERRLQELLCSGSGQDARQLLMSSALLQQDVVREVLEDKPTERYQHLATLLGLDQLGAFETEVRKRASRLSDAGKAARMSLQAAEDRAQHLETRVGNLEASRRMAADVLAASAGITTRITSLGEIVSLDPMPATAAEAAIAQNSAQLVGTQLAELAKRKRALDDEDAALEAPDRDLVARLSAAVAKSGEEVARLSELASDSEKLLGEATKRSSQLTALAADAIQLLGPTCPVCGQDIDQHEVRHHLQERISTSEAGHLATSLEAAEGARRALDAARSVLAAQQAELAPLTIRSQRRESIEAARKDWSQQVALYELPQASPLRLARLDSIQAGDLESIDSAVETLRLVWVATGDLTAALRSDAGENQLVEVQADVRRAREAVAIQREAASLASKQEERGKLLQRATTRAVAAVTERRFKRLQPTAQDIYWRLDPHPSFTTFDFELSVYNARAIATPIVRDDDGEASGDPLLLFSSSQANVVALSYFLALGWAAGADAIPFVLLDDPLQSMDDVNALGFADLCRHLRRHRQLVVSTHEQRLGGLLQRKLAPRRPDERTRVIEFKAWTRDGPIIDQTVISPQVQEGGRRSVVTAEAA